MSQASQEDTKNCKDCSMFKGLGEFHVCRSSADGRQRYCKECLRKRVYENRQTRAERGEPDSSSESEEATRESAQHLYVMTNSRIAGEYKIGRSKSVQQRRSDLQESQNFQVKIVATFPGAGWAEGSVHDRLAYARVRAGPGREWFAAPLSEILHAVGRALEGGA